MAAVLITMIGLGVNGRHGQIVAAETSKFGPAFLAVTNVSV